jgi:5-methylcytosine-specific restriction endonuclease McrA
MNERGFWQLGGVSDGALEVGAAELLGAGARLEARLVAHLAEIDARKLALRAGHSSLYDYCRKRLGLSDYEAFSRIAAARVARRFPVVFQLLDRREVTLTTLCELREFLNEENHVELLDAVKRKTKLQVREVLAERFPRADVAANARRLPTWDPLSSGRYRLELTLSAEQKDKLEYARGLLGHAEASGDLARVLERGLDLLIAKLEQRRLGSLSAKATTKRAAAGPGTSTAPQDRATSTTPRDRATSTAPRDRATSTAPRDRATSTAPRDRATSTTPQASTAVRETGRDVRQHIPLKVRRQVVARDGACCAFVGEDGHRCGARERLEFHHKLAWARRGPDTVENLQLLCRAHHRWVTELELGTDHVEQAIAKRRSDARREGDEAA